jgi:hypothetical protein
MGFRGRARDKFALPLVLVACGGAIAPGEGKDAAPDEGRDGSFDAHEASTPAPPDEGGTTVPQPLVLANDGTCVPWSQAAGEPFLASPSDPLSQPASALLDATAASFVGSWIGHASAPPNWLPPSWDLVVQFTSNGPHGGQYAAQSNALPFYYGSQASSCSTLRQWRLFGVLADGVQGELDVPFDYGASLPCELPTWQGVLTRIATNVSSSRLRFDFRTSDGYGPVAYDLWRICAP